MAKVAEKPVEKPKVEAKYSFYGLVEVKGGGFQLYKKDVTLEGAEPIDAPDLRSLCISRVARILGRQ